MPICPALGRKKPLKNRPMKYSMLRLPESLLQADVARTRTSTSSSLGTGLSTSVSRRTSGGPYRSKRTALTDCLS
jgi:hypothetical protein